MNDFNMLFEIVLITSIIFYGWGFFTVYKNIFPYKLIKLVKEKIYPVNTDHNRFLNDENLNFIDVNSINTEELGVFVTYGQSNSANHGQIGYLPKNKVYMFNNGNIYKYKDPSIGASGIDGSVWGLTGDKLINSGLYKEVSFTNTGWGGEIHIRTQ